MPVRPAQRRSPAPRAARKDPAVQGTLDAAYRLQQAGSLMEAELLYRRVLQSEPGNPFCLYALGTISLNRGESERAVEFLRAALLQGYVHETVFTHLGIALQGLGRQDEALDLYRLGMKNEPANPRYPSNASVILAQRGDHEGALELARKALAMDANFAPACSNAAFFLQELGRLQEAADMFDRALLLDPQNEPLRAALQAVRQKLAATPGTGT
ncbi:MAG: tetratricopeptide repeat protein [Acidobacteria bacterium]|nr:tetratricopeptide repeat protein [Acidobacteriota bacterium]